MLYEGTRDFLRAYLRMCFDPEETVKAEVQEKALPRYLPAFEKVSVYLKSKIVVPPRRNRWLFQIPIFIAHRRLRARYCF